MAAALIRKRNVRPSQLIIVGGARPKSGRCLLAQRFDCKGRENVGNAPSQGVEIYFVRRTLLIPPDNSARDRRSLYLSSSLR
jgi:hypothetical protein